MSIPTQHAWRGPTSTWWSRISSRPRTAFHADGAAGIRLAGKDGTVTNTPERLEGAAELPGEVRQDWWIIQRLPGIGLDGNMTIRGMSSRRWRRRRRRATSLGTVRERAR